MEQIDFNITSRGHVWHKLVDSLNQYLDQTEQLAVSPSLDQDEISKWVRQPLQDGLGIDQAMNHVLQGMRQYTVHTPHPSYYGLFNPRANFPSILADTITATFNPQMAAWSHSPFAAEVERYLIDEIAQAFGFEQADGVFASGGAEANQTAVLCALNHAIPHYATKGLVGQSKQPIIYCSTEAHHSVLKSARSSGLGGDCVHTINVDNSLKMCPESLEKQIKQDIQAGYAPLMVVATFGTTGAGSLDSIDEIHQIVDNYGLWLHVDAAYGGALAWSPPHIPLCRPLRLAHSITYDLHKWMSVPMGCSVFVTQNQEILHKTFRVTTEYMPKEAQDLAVTDAFTHSIQWSRRFIGLKLYLSVLTFGWQGYQQLIAHTLTMKDRLVELLNPHWKITNDSALPIVCCIPKEPVAVEKICQQVVASGQAWVSVYPINGVASLRICITNYQTQESHLVGLVDLLNGLLKS